MTLRTQALLAALAATSWSLASTTALAQTPEEPPPSPSAAQDPATQEPAAPMPPAQNSTDRTTPSDSAGQSTDRSAAATAPAGAPIEDRKIEQFADAYLAVHSIQQKASQELQAASTPEEANKVKANAESEMIAAVERSGLQVPEFNHIVETMAADANVRSRVAAKLQERTGAAPDDGGV